MKHKFFIIKTRIAFVFMALSFRRTHLKNKSVTINGGSTTLVSKTIATLQLVKIANLLSDSFLHKAAFSASRISTRLTIQNIFKGE